MIGIYTSMWMALVAVGVLLWGASAALARAVRVSAIDVMRVARVAFSAALLLPLASRYTPGAERAFDVLPKGEISDAIAQTTNVLAHAEALRIGAFGTGSALAWTAALGAAVALWRWARATRALTRHLRALPLVRRMGRVRVVLDKSAYAFLSQGAAWVAVTDARDRIALRHELMHHRRGDTRFLHVLALAGAPFPGACWVWRRFSQRWQERACDEAVLERGTDPREYAETLLAATERTQPMLAHAMAHPTVARIAALFDVRPRRRLSWALAPLALALAFAASSVNAANVNPGAVAAALKASTLGLSSHPKVVSAIEALLANPKKRAWIKEGVQALKAQRAAFDQAFDRHGLPTELSVLAIAESGVKNLVETSTQPSLAPGMRGAGVWMFIPSTARRFGLRVDKDVDERMDIGKETEAAGRLLSELHRIFGSWPLAIAAYNMGDAAVTKAIKEGGTRDPWTLVEKGKLNDYLVQIAAVAAVVNDPTLLD